MKTTVDLYFWINCFFTFSLIGYILECIVLTVENRKPVYNRGFGHGPFALSMVLEPLGRLFYLDRFLMTW